MPLRVSPSRGRPRVTALPSVSVRDNRITEKGLELPQVATGLQSDLIERKGECLAGSRDLIYGHRVETVMTAPPDLTRRANQPMPHDPLAGSVAVA